jgi:sugar lactone lactonase YvrE
MSVRADDVELVLDARAELGESPAWDAATGRLLWADISAGVVHRYDPATATDERFEVGRPIGAVVPAAEGRFVVAASDGFAELDADGGTERMLAAIDADDARTIMNDGKCDPAGRFWAGTKDVEGVRPLGSLYRLDADRTVTRVVSGIVISNGLGWSPDGSTMYYIDSARYAVDAFEFEVDSGSASHRRCLTELPRAWGLPDGMTVDEEGCLWIAFWTGSAIRRLTPDGRVVATIELPVSLVTSCAFGGDGSDLYVTSARIALSPARLRDEPLAGGLFRLSPGVRGPAATPYAGA